MRSVAFPLALLVLTPACDLYLRSDDPVGDDDVGPLPDAAPQPDAADLDAGPAIDAAPLPNPGFVTPTSTTRANAFRNGQWTDVGAADWSCLAQPSEPVPMGGYTLTGTVRDYGTSQSVGAATIVASVNGATVANATSATGGGGTRGTYRMDIPALPTGATRVRFTVSAGNAKKTIAIDRYLGQVGVTTLDLPILSLGTVGALPDAVGAPFEDGDGLLVGELRDCQGRQVSGAILALSTSPNFVAHWPEGLTFYFAATGQISPPVDHATRTETNRDGRFMVLGADPLGGAEGTLQAWGFPTEADRAAGTLRLLGTSAAVVDAEAVGHVLIGRTRQTSIGG